MAGLAGPLGSERLTTEPVEKPHAQFSLKRSDLRRYVQLHSLDPLRCAGKVQPFRQRAEDLQIRTSIRIYLSDFDYLIQNNLLDSCSPAVSR
jgi:hypothetical protein